MVIFWRKKYHWGFRRISKVFLYYSHRTLEGFQQNSNRNSMGFSKYFHRIPTEVSLEFYQGYLQNQHGILTIPTVFRTQFTEDSPMTLMGFLHDPHPPLFPQEFKNHLNVFQMIYLHFTQFCTTLEQYFNMTLTGFSQYCHWKTSIYPFFHLPIPSGMSESTLE